MSNVGRRYTAAAKEFLLEREYAEEPIDDAAHDFGSTLTPRPHLGGHQVNHGYSQRTEFPGYAEVEVGRIGQDRELGPACSSGSHKPAEILINAGDMGNYLN
jgi:hypothetical protein